ADDPVSLARRAVMAGAIVSSVKLTDALPGLPAASVSLAMTVWDPVTRPGGAGLPAPAGSAVAAAAGGARPSGEGGGQGGGRRAGVAGAMEVIASVDDDPVSLARCAVMVGAIVSSVKVTDALPAGPAAMMVCDPLTRPVGV